MTATSIETTAIPQDRSLTAREIMYESPRTCSRFSHVIEAVLILKEGARGTVPVIDEGKPIGVVTDRGLSLALSGLDSLPERPIEEVMDVEPMVVLGSASLAVVAATLARAGEQDLLVTDEANTLIGLIGWKELTPALSDRELVEFVRAAFAPLPV